MKLAPTHNPSDKVISEIQSKWRNRGFPHYQLSMPERLKEIKTFMKYDRTGMIENNVIKQTLHALGTTWHYFPHHWNVRVGKMRTAFDVWDDEELLRKAIISRIKWGGYELCDDGTADLSSAYMRKALRTYSGVQRVSNFRPSASASIYDHYAGDGTVWDMSCGYGGRLLGAIVSDKVKLYIGTEPASLTFNGLEKLAEDFAGLTGTAVELNQVGSENFVPRQEVDLCFTSPPYFNTERYSDEDTQSAIKFPTVEDWNNKFLRQTIQNSCFCLKSKGYLILNVASVKSHQTLEKDAVSIAISEGLTLVKVLKLTLSSISKGGYKYEPVFVFQKRL